MKNFTKENIYEAKEDYQKDVERADKTISKLQNEIKDARNLQNEAQQRIEQNLKLINEQQTQKFKMLGAIDLLNDLINKI
jgi:hypothetical protein